jgi:hypothetical protein
MCMYSLYDERNTRPARVGEVLTRGDYRGHEAFLTREPSAAPMLACIRHGTTLVIDRVRFVPGTSDWIVEAYQGAPLEVMFVDGSSYHGISDGGYAADSIVLPCGKRVPFYLLAEGVTAKIPRKVRKDRGISRPRSLTRLFDLNNLPPEPKPEDEVPVVPANNDEPAPVKEPVAPETAPAA